MSSPMWRWCSTVVGSSFRPMMVEELMRAKPITRHSRPLKPNSAGTV